MLRGDVLYRRTLEESLHSFYGYCINECNCCALTVPKGLLVLSQPQTIGSP